MIIAADASGRLGNRLSRFAEADAEGAFGCTCGCGVVELTKIGDKRC